MPSPAKRRRASHEPGGSARKLEALGWGEPFAGAAAGAQDLVPARVLSERGGACFVSTGEQVFPARASGKMRHEAAGMAALPAVGDWVLVRSAAPRGSATIHRVLPRRSTLSRRTAGRRAEEQVLAANVDVAFILMGLDGDYNPRRLERYLALVRSAGAEPVVLLTKADQVDDVDDCRDEVAALAGGAPVLAVDARAAGVRRVLSRHLQPGRTVVLLGSSGAGKSTLINRLLGREVQRTASVRENDSRGRHTTTHRELFALANGALVIDTPGLRELQLWHADQGLDAAFDDVRQAAAGCRFRDCRHDAEPGCAVRAAIDAGELDPDRLVSYQQLREELEAARKRW